VILIISLLLHNREPWVRNSTRTPAVISYLFVFVSSGKCQDSRPHLMVGNDYTFQYSFQLPFRLKTISISHLTHYVYIPFYDMSPDKSRNRHLAHFHLMSMSGMDGTLTSEILQRGCFLAAAPLVFVEVFGGEFEYQLGHRFAGLKFLLVFLNHVCRCRHSTSITRDFFLPHPSALVTQSHSTLLYS
jgi:hypothetical protein